MSFNYKLIHSMFQYELTNQGLKTAKQLAVFSLYLLNALWNL
jgi:hypothetical protein